MKAAEFVIRLRYDSPSVPVSFGATIWRQLDDTSHHLTAVLIHASRLRFTATTTTRPLLASTILKIPTTQTHAITLSCLFFNSLSTNTHSRSDSRSTPTTVETFKCVRSTVADLRSKHYPRPAIDRRICFGASTSSAFFFDQRLMWRHRLARQTRFSLASARHLIRCFASKLAPALFCTLYHHHHHQNHHHRTTAIIGQSDMPTAYLVTI